MIEISRNIKYFVNIGLDSDCCRTVMELHMSDSEPYAITLHTESQMLDIDDVKRLAKALGIVADQMQIDKKEVVVDD
jgi:hypothetical protein